MVYIARGWQPDLTTDRDELLGAVSFGASTFGDEKRDREQALILGAPDRTAQAERTLFDEGLTVAELRDAAPRSDTCRRERFTEAFESLTLVVVLLDGLALFGVAAYAAHLPLPEGVGG